MAALVVVIGTFDVTPPPGRKPLLPMP